MADHRAAELPIWVDAIVRAWRTFYVSVGIDILAAIAVGLTTALEGGDVMSLAFWTGVVGLVVRSILTGVATYWMRLKFPPQV